MHALDVEISTDYIPLNDLLKLCNVVSSGGAGKALVASGSGLGLMHQDEARGWARTGEVCILEDLEPMPIDICFLFRRDRADERS